MSQHQNESNEQKALELEEHRLAQRVAEQDREVERKSIEIRSQFVVHGHGPGSGTTIAALREPEIDRLRQLMQDANANRRELCKRFPRLGTSEYLGPLRETLRGIVDTRWRDLHVRIARLAGGNESEVRTLLDARFGTGISELKAEVDREIGIIERECGLGLHAGEQPAETVELDLCFVLMPFAPELVDVYVGTIRPATVAAGLRCERADDSARPGVILEHIDESIRQARVIVADLTGLNPNVMHEVGFARAHGKPIIFITQGEFRDLPFDVRHYRAFRYRQDPEGLAALSNWLRQSFRAVLGEPAVAGGETEPLLLPLNWVQQNIQPKLEAEGDEFIYPSHDRVDQYKLEGWEDIFWPDEHGRRRRVVTVDHRPLRRRLPSETR